MTNYKSFFTCKESKTVLQLFHVTLMVHKRVAKFFKLTKLQQKQPQRDLPILLPSLLEELVFFMEVAF